MRNHIISLIGKAAQTQPDIVFLTGDLGFSVVEPLQAQLGERFINAGISEANMMSMAASLSFCGLEPFVYSIAPFVTARCYEQVRNDICYHNARVRIIGIGAGFSYGTLGPSHHALEDATIMATLPAMTVFSPATLSELDRLFALSDGIAGPVYYRIGRENGPDLAAPQFDLDNPVVVWRRGAGLNLVTSGSLAGEVFAAADFLEGLGHSVRLITVPVLAPFPHEALSGALCDAPTLVVFEGYVGNPLESGAAMALALRPAGRPVRFLNAGREFAKVVGGTDHQRKTFGLSADAIVAAAQEFLK